MLVFNYGVDYMSNNGLIFNIQHFSIHDGPGIRTTVFLKGCPLKCPWCSNPESQSNKIQITWDSDKCVRCKKCISTCTENAIEYKDDKILIDEKKCSISLNCVKNCPESALAYEGEYKTVDEIIENVLKDRDFYEESGGGLTLSGGEVLQQPRFAIEILKKAKENNLNTAVETTCFTNKEIFKEFIQYVDLLLCDIKHYDNVKHEEIIGVPLNRIHENIKYAVSIGKDIIGRIPVIPKFNYSLEDADKLSDLILELGIKKVELLPYHNFGENKYRLLNREYQLKDVEVLHKDDDDFIEYSNIFKEKGLELL